MQPLPVQAGNALINLSDPPAQCWEATNPGGGGWFERVGVGPSGIVVACSDLSGAYISYNKGEWWENIGFQRGLTETHVASVGFPPADPDIILLGTEAGIFRSNDAGAHFNRVLSDGYIECFAFSPAEPATGYAAWHSAYNSLEAHIYKTTDSGLTWSRVDADFPAFRRVVKLVVTNTTPGVIFALTGNGRFVNGPGDVYRSTDGGSTWLSVGALFNNRVVDISPAPSDADVIYASVDDADIFELGYLYRSDNLGDSWTFLSRRSGHIWLDADDPQVIRMIESDLQYPWLDQIEGFWESTQAGSSGSFQKISSVNDWVRGWSTAYWTFNATSEHGAFAADPSAPDYFYWVNSQFVYRSADRGRTVTQVYTTEAGGQGTNRWQSRGIDNVVIMVLDINETNPDEIYAGFYDLGTFRSLDGGYTWTAINDPEHTGDWEGAGGNTLTLLTDPDLGGKIWSAQSDGQDGPSALLVSTNAGDDWSVVGNGLPPSLYLGLSLDRNSNINNRTMFITADGDVYRSRDGGLSWNPVLLNGGLRFTEVDRSDGNIIYAGGENGFWRSADGGDTWSETGLTLMRGSYPGEPSRGWEGVYDIKSDPHVPGRVYVVATGTGKGLFRSNDYGLTWEAGQTPLLAGDFLRRLAVSPLDPDIIFITSSSAYDSGGYETGSRGVLRSIDGGQTWEQLTDGLSWPFAIPIVIGPAPDAVVFIGSPGTGIHRLVPCNSPCAADLDDDGDVDQADLGILLAAYDINSAGDIDGDGDTDQADLGILLAYYDQPCP